jgi:predicted DNA repair protein MutK
MADAAISGVFGLLLGGVIVAVHHWWAHRKGH